MRKTAWYLHPHGVTRAIVISKKNQMLSKGQNREKEAPNEHKYRCNWHLATYRVYLA